jgi:hypothetical protein
MIVSLRDWAKNGWLTEHKSSPQEIAELLRVADRDLVDCQVSGLSSDWRLSIAYNAALKLGTAALAAEGYRASREAHHYRIIQSLAFTIGAGKELVIQLDQFRKKRNISDYERAGMVSDLEANEMIALAEKLRKHVLNWLHSNQPELLLK